MQPRPVIAKVLTSSMGTSPVISIFNLSGLGPSLSDIFRQLCQQIRTQLQTHSYGVNESKSKHCKDNVDYKYINHSNMIVTKRYIKAAIKQLLWWQQSMKDRLKTYFSKPIITEKFRSGFASELLMRNIIIRFSNKRFIWLIQLYTLICFPGYSPFTKIIYTKAINTQSGKYSVSVNDIVENLWCHLIMWYGDLLLILKE